jgi:hypothetical protein
MNNVLLNTVGLDGEVIIKKGGGGGEVTIKNQEKSVAITENGVAEVTADAGFTGLGKVTINTNVPTGGGETELEGEYYLAKPNGRYWKTKFFKFDRPNVPTFDISKVSEEQTEMVLLYLLTMSYCGYSVIGLQGGIPDSAWETTSFSPIESCERCSRLLGELTVSQKLSFLIPAAFEECNFKIQERDVEGVVGFMRMMMGEEVDNMTDEEVLTLASEMLMIEPITKEEYDTWKYWNIN